MLSKLQDMVAKREISVTEAEAVKLSKRPKDVPLLDKVKYQLDEQI